MERFSNDILAPRTKARDEVSLSHIENDEKMFAFFSAYPCIIGFPFAIDLIENEKGEMRSKFKQWDTH